MEWSRERESLRFMATTQHHLTYISQGVTCFGGLDNLLCLLACLIWYRLITSLMISLLSFAHPSNARSATILAKIVQCNIDIRMYSCTTAPPS